MTNQEISKKYAPPPLKIKIPNLKAPKMFMQTDELPELSMVNLAHDFIAETLFKGQAAGRGLGMFVGKNFREGRQESVVVAAHGLISAPMAQVIIKPLYFEDDTPAIGQCLFLFMVGQQEKSRCIVTLHSLDSYCFNTLHFLTNQGTINVPSNMSTPLLNN